MQYMKPYKLVHRFQVLASKYYSPANFDCDSGFRVYFLFNSFAKHRSSNLQLLLDCSVQFIDRKFNNKNVTNVTQTKIPSPKFALSIVAKKQQPYVCNYVSKRGPNTCKKQMFSSPKSANNPPMQYANGDISPVILLVTSCSVQFTYHASNITCPRIEYHMPKVTVEWTSSPHNNSECISCIPN